MSGKILIAIALTAGLIGGGFYLLNSPKKPAADEIVDVNTDLAPLACDMNTNFSCPVKFNGKTINFSLSPRPVFVMQPVSMWIEGLGDMKDPSLEISGVNMQMGVIKAKLEKRGDEYKADVALSACVISLMRYRFDVLEGGKKTGLYIDFDLKQ